MVAPELEFYLVRPNTDPDYPLEPPTGRSGRPEVGRQSYSISALNEFDDLIDDIYDLSEKQGLEIDTMIHEEGAAQMEINLRHGDPLALADQVFLFKRTIRESALRHDMYATFMSKPMSNQPGSAMHIHQSVLDKETGKNIFASDDGVETEAFLSFIAGHQKYLPHATCIMAPFVNSYRRFSKTSTAPVNVYWGYDNRTVGLRVPYSSPDARRLENRIPGCDANPYLAIASSLACGYLGIVNGLKPDAPRTDDCQEMAKSLPRGLPEALSKFENSEEMVEIFGETFVATYRAIKYEEFETFMSVISPLGAGIPPAQCLRPKSCFYGALPMTAHSNIYPTKALQDLDAAHHWHPFSDMKSLNEEGSRIITSADGVWLTDSDGKKIMDGMAGLWCVQVGHGRSEITNAVTRQMNELAYYNTFFKTTHPPAIALSEKLAKLAPDHINTVFYCSSGSEANDTVFRMVRTYWDKMGKPDKKTIIGRWKRLSWINTSRDQPWRHERHARAR